MITRPTQTAEKSSRTPYGTASRFTGVGWSKRINRWVAGITVNRKPRYLGSFDDEIAAARAYDEAAREALGELAGFSLNFPDAADRERAAAWIGRHEARQRFGVSLKTWERWEREGRIQCGKRIGGGPKLYRIADIKRLLEEFGRFAPPYPHPDMPGCYLVPLTGRDIRRREVIIDAESLPLIEGRQWCWCEGSSEGKGMVVQARRGETTPLRRIILGVTDEPSEEVQVAHVNGDPLDCRRENLILRTITQRLASARKRKTHHGKPCSSQYKGVSWHSQTETWRAQIHAEGKTHHLGTFYNEVDAAEAYDEAARELFGEHARLNFPDDGSSRNLAGAFEDGTPLRAAA